MNNINFIALDLETATQFRGSICEIGLAFVQNGEIVDTKSWLVKPHKNQYDAFNISIHGITPEMTANAEDFPTVWSEIEEFISNQIIVAHNSAFDMYALKDAFDFYGMSLPIFNYYCSLRIARKVFRGHYSYSLPNLCHDLGINFSHHHRAGGDSIGCAEIMLKSFDKTGAKSFDQLAEMMSIKKGCYDGSCHIPQHATRNYSGLGHNIDLSTIQGDESKFDPDNYFYGKAVCFTGVFSFGIRKELLQAVADIGGTPMNSVTKATNVLVVGQQDYRVVGEEGMSSKQKKAMELIKKGQDLEIMSESDFLETFGLSIK